MPTLAPRNGNAILPKSVHRVWPVFFLMDMRVQIVLILDRPRLVTLWIDFLDLLTTKPTRPTTVGDIPAALFGSCDCPPEGEADLDHCGRLLIRSCSKS